jgi:hypothetical protein
MDMKITIDFDPTTATVKVTSPPSAEGDAVTQAATKPAVQGVALDAGACSGIALGEGPAAVPPPIINAGIASATGSPPTPHLDTFGLLTGISAGSPKR